MGVALAGSLAGQGDLRLADPSKGTPDAALASLLPWLVPSLPFLGQGRTGGRKTGRRRPSEAVRIWARPAGDGLLVQPAVGRGSVSTGMSWLGVHRLPLAPISNSGMLKEGGGF